MTFEEFQATGKDVPDLKVVDHHLEGATGRVYDGIYWTQKHNGYWSTIICNSEPHSKNLEVIERELYDWYMSTSNPVIQFSHYSIQLMAFSVTDDGKAIIVTNALDEDVSLHDIVSVDGYHLTWYLFGHKNGKEQIVSHAETFPEIKDIYESITGNRLEDTGTEYSNLKR